MTSADLCRIRGWTVGTVLIGDEGFGPSTIVITAIGERAVLAKHLNETKLHESLWDLQFRDWKKVSE